MRLVLDTMIVSALCSPRDNARHQEVSRWFVQLVRCASDRLEAVVPEIVDYEVRRGLLKIANDHLRESTRALRKLDALVETCHYLPIQTSMMRDAAQLWADARSRGTPTARPASLDADVILAAQARHVRGIVITENVTHLSQFGPTRRWRDVDPESIDI